MTTLIFPDPRDAKDTIADCLDVLAIAPSTVARHEQIVNNCVTPLTLLIKAGEMVSAAGPEEEAVFAYFIGALYAQLCQPAQAGMVEAMLSESIHDLTARP